MIRRIQRICCDLRLRKEVLVSAIAGIIRQDNQAVDRATLERMQALLTPYGQDAQQRWQQGPAGLLRTLLRTTPQDSFDRQPLQSDDGQLMLVFDGRLDNRADVVSKLGVPPQEAARMADSDLVLRACRRWDTDAVRHLVGDFSLACWSAARSRLWLARDPLGGRPLFWHQQSGFFAFSSLPKALFAIPGVPRALCEERMLDSLALLHQQGSESFFKDIHRVEPGHCLVVEGGRISSHCYHRFDPQYEIRFANDNDYVEAFQERLEQAIASCLRSSGPVASHLSSGFDSSTVAALSARQLAGRNQRLTAYTSVPEEGFSDRVMAGRHGDEEPGAAALVARFSNIDHQLIRANGVSPLANLQASIEAMDRAPLNLCNGVWLDAIQADAAARGNKVLLTGQAGNMGISYTGLPYLPALWQSGHWLAWWREVKALKRTHPHRRWRGLIAHSIEAALPRPVMALIAKRLGKSTQLMSYSPIHPDCLAQVDMQARARARGWDIKFRQWPDGRRMRIAVLGRMDAGEYAASANVLGLEVRDPTRDLRLLEYCLAVPDNQYLRNGQTRWLLKRAMGEILPPEILNATSKGYQAADWYKNTQAALPQLREELRTLQAHGKVGQMIDLEALQRIVDTWPETGWDKPEIVMKYRFKLLRGIAAGNFIRYVEQNNR